MGGTYTLITHKKKPKKTGAKHMTIVEPELVAVAAVDSEKAAVDSEEMAVDSDVAAVMAAP